MGMEQINPLKKIEEAIAQLTPGSGELDIDSIRSALTEAHAAASEGLQRTTKAESADALADQLSAANGRIDSLTGKLSAAIAEVAQKTQHLQRFDAILQDMRNKLKGKVTLAYPKDLHQSYFSKIEAATDPKELITLAATITEDFNKAWMESIRANPQAPPTNFADVIFDPSPFKTGR